MIHFPRSTPACPWRAAAALLWLMTLSLAVGEAQEAPGTEQPRRATVPARELTVETVQQRLEEVDVLPHLDDTAREELRGTYQEALRDLAAAAESARQAAAFAELARDAANQLRAANAQLAELESAVTIDVPPDATLSKLEELLQSEEDRLAAAKRRKEVLEAENGRRQARRAEIPGKAQALRDTRQQLIGELAATAATTEPEVIAQRTKLEAKIAAIDQELTLYEQELAAYSATAELLPIERDLSQRLASLAEKRVSLWREAVEERRARDVAQQEAIARVDAEVTTGILTPLAVRNSELAQRSSQLVEKIQEVNRDLETSRAVLEKTQQQFKVTKEKVERVGLSYAIGLLLRKEDASLPDMSRYRRRSREREELIRDAQLRIIDLAEERSRLTDVDFVESFIDATDRLPRGITRDEFAEAAGRLLDRQLALLTTLQQNEDAYFERLVELESTEQQLRKEVSLYETYIDERVLWIRSSELIGPGDVRRWIAAWQWLGDGHQWRETFLSLRDDFLQHIVPAGLCAVLWLALLLVQPRLRRAIAGLGERASSGSCRRFLPTLMALAWTLLITSLWPLLILLVAWRLTVVPQETGFGKAIGAGLMAAGVYFAALEFLRQICRSRGLADAHFSWVPGARTALRSNLRWLIVASTPMVYAAAMLYADAESRSQDTLGVSRSQESLARLFVLATLIATIVFVHRTLRPAGPLFRAMEETAGESRLYRLRRVAYSLIMFLLGSLLVLAVIGYDFTVARLCRRSFESFLLLEVLVVAMSLVQRWLILVRRRLAINRAQQRRAQAATPGGDTSGTVAQINVEEHAPDLDMVGEQSRQLLQFVLVISALAGLWFIWIDVLPALRFFDQFELWSVSVGAITSTITLNHVVVACVIIMATVLATRNIPGLMEIIVLSRLPLDAGNRYALIMICRYVIIIVGIIFAFGSIGIPWSSYQWLVAAVTVGLGFGLQEIFSNFVSGLIVLFEQPIRVGDIVTIGDVTGVVSRIRMRATTVTNWENQEYIVPNREFITGKLLNWTLTNAVNRVTITVGVAYGTDPDLVRRVLLGIAEQHPLVLDSPAPNVTFESFGDSTLNILLRCYLPNLENRLGTIHDLNTAAHRELGAAGIEFAFPTRELFLRSRPSAQQQVDELTRSEGNSGSV